VPGINVAVTVAAVVVGVRMSVMHVLMIMLMIMPMVVPVSTVSMIVHIDTIMFMVVRVCCRKKIRFKVRIASCHTIYRAHVHDCDRIAHEIELPS
jgi:hypothetical protein